MSGTTCIAASLKCVSSLRPRNRKKKSANLYRKLTAQWKPNLGDNARRFHQRCDLKDHERFEELASLAPLGELSQQEYEEFLEHLSSCDHCRKTYDSSAV